MLIPIGGFLGAGKTTLLARAAWEFQALGWRVAAVTNDQAAGLVDTASLRASGLRVAEVAGGCFCCRFWDLEHAVTKLQLGEPTRAILAEPVGSCTDLAATVVRPWLKILGREAAPLSVLVDHARLPQALETSAPGPLPPESAYILRKQLEEADVIVLTKLDELDAPRRRLAVKSLDAAFPGRRIFETAAITGEGVAEWAAYIFNATGGEPGGNNRIDVDYDLYARGEAALGWLNAEGAAELGARDGAAVCGTILEEMRQACTTGAGEIAHVKVRLEAGRGAGASQGHLSSNTSAARVSGTCAGASRLLLNAQVAMEPARLRETTGRAIGRIAGVGLTTVECFSPGRPVPTHRL